MRCVFILYTLSQIRDFLPFLRAPDSCYIILEKCKDNQGADRKFFHKIGIKLSLILANSRFFTRGEWHLTGFFGDASLWVRWDFLLAKQYLAKQRKYNVSKKRKGGNGGWDSWLNAPKPQRTIWGEKIDYRPRNIWGQVTSSNNKPQHKGK